jgi:hypothetical protein
MAQARNRLIENLVASLKEESAFNSKQDVFKEGMELLISALYRGSDVKD